MKSPRRFRSPLMAFAAATFLSSTVALEVSAFDFPEETQIEGCPLVLNGTAVRSVWGIKIYAVGLFLTEKNGNGASIMGVDRGEKRIQIAMLREVSKDQFISTIKENIVKNFSAAEQEKFEAEIAAFFNCFDGGSELTKGSTVMIDYVPAKGMIVVVNDRCFEPIAGDDFYHAILRLWIGKPLQESIRVGLLGMAE